MSADRTAFGWQAPESSLIAICAFAHVLTAFEGGKFSFASDVFSFGGMLWEMVARFGLFPLSHYEIRCREQPWKDRGYEEVVKGLLNGKRLPMPDVIAFSSPLHFDCSFAEHAANLGPHHLRLLEAGA